MLLRGGATCVAQNINPGLSQPAGERGWKALCEWRESEVTVLCCDPDSMAPVIGVFAFLCCVICLFSQLK